MFYSIFLNVKEGEDIYGREAPACDTEEGKSQAWQEVKSHQAPTCLPCVTGELAEDATGKILVGVPAAEPAAVRGAGLCQWGHAVRRTDTSLANLPIFGLAQSQLCHVLASRGAACCCFSMLWCLLLQGWLYLGGNRVTKLGKSFEITVVAIARHENK